MPDKPIDLKTSMQIAASGMRAQSDRLRVISQNIANADSTGLTPGSDPYRRKTITFKSALNKELGVETVKVTNYGYDKTPFPMKYDPSHPAADDKGYVKLPNVNTMIEAADMREAQKSYEANIGVIDTSKSMIARTLDLLR